MRIVAPIVAFLVVSLVLGPLLGIFGLLGAGVVAFLTYRAFAPSRHAPASPGAPTFKWKHIEVFSDEQVLYFAGEPIPFDKISKIEYVTGGNQGCLGGRLYTIHVYVEDLRSPRRSMNVGNITFGGNRQAEENYERLRIALGIR